MSYYIKPTYPELSTSKPSKLFHSWLGDYKVVDTYNSWSFEGDFYIYGNFYLPPNSFKLNFQTFFASVENINLVYKDKILSKSFDNQQAYIINQYCFKFDVYVANSSFFNSYITYKNINFSISPSFDNNILNSYTIQATQSDFDKFNNEISSSINSSSFSFSNFYNLDETHSSLDLALKNDDPAIIDLYTYNLFSNSLINKLIKIRKNDEELLLITNQKITIKYRFKNETEFKEISLNLADIYIYEREADLTINVPLVYDNLTKTLIHDKYASNGIYFPLETIGIITYEFGIDYHNKIRNFRLERQFYFDKNLENDLNSLIDLSTYKIDRKLLSEVQSEKIY